MISIIIIVKNDRKIDKALQQLGKIDKPTKSEIIVVDASSGLLNDIKNKYPHVHWIDFKAKTTKKTTIPEQRNIGIKAAKGDILSFIDSDCTPSTKWLTELSKYIQDGSEKIVSGRVILEDTDSPYEIENEKNLNREYIGECPTMNVAYAREIFERVGYFDENFLYGSDVDLSWRATNLGYKIRFNKKATIYHDTGDARNNYRRMYVYGRARTRLYKKHTYRWKFFVCNEMTLTLYPLYFILLPLTMINAFYPFLIMIPIIKWRKRSPLQLISLKTMYGLGIIRELLLR